MLKSENLLEIALKLSKDISPTHRFSSLELDENDVWIINNDDVLKATEPENIEAFIRAILRAHSRIIPTNLSADLLMAHLNLMAPTLPLDFLPIVGDALAQKIPTATLLSKRLDLAITLSERRKNATSNENLAWDIGYDTHIGRRKSWYSQTNQDNFFYAVHDQTALFLVADGISTSTAGSGDIASKIAVHVANHFWEKHKAEYETMSQDKLIRNIYIILENINYNICETAKQYAPDGIEKEIPMGTTMVLGIAQGPKITLATLGDSRIYALLESGIAQVTGDQNVRGEKLRHHIPLESEREGSALLRYLGRFNPDSSESEMLPPDIITFNLLPKEALVFCSDGVTDFISGDYYSCNQAIVEASLAKDPMQICWELTRLANQGGGGDNITSIFARLCHL